MKQFFHISWKFKATAADTLGFEVFTKHYILKQVCSVLSWVQVTWPVQYHERQ
jgi:hypothetical protein